MLILIMGLGVFLGVRAVRAVLASLRSLPRSNEDWIWY
jgi:hypothetical protein